MSSYSQNESRPAGEWAVTLFPQTFSVRLFETEGKAREFYSGVAGGLKKELFLEAADFLKVMSLPKMLHYVEELTTARSYKTYDCRDNACERPELDARVPLSVARALWAVCQAVGDSVRGSPGKNKAEKPEFRFSLDALTDEVVATFPKQARQILQEVARLKRSTYSDEDVQVMMRQMVAGGRLKTRQDPLLVFGFYAPQFADMGLLSYPGRRSKSEAAEDPSPVEAAA